MHHLLALHRMTHLEMPPLVPVSELHGKTLVKRRAYLGGFCFGESLTLALGDDKRAAYGIPPGPITVVGRATKGTAVPFGSSGGIAA
jgi:hypothetical protein